ncbi:hypothetical protein LOAG_08069 [Loa loa]|nr:hypothetical protein LOAG_08069 [Loa loa]EFO20420.1 hypothetical protein LOAG_08069 [Loa loa]
MNLQIGKNIGYRYSKAKSVVMNKPETKRGENQRYEQQVKLLNPKKGAEPILSMHETEDDSDDFDLLMNLESGHRDMLTPKPSIWPNTTQFSNRISKRTEYGNQKQTGYLTSNSDCIVGTVTGNQRWNQLNTIVQSGKIWTPRYQIPKVFPALAPQYGVNYQQNPASWDKVSIFRGSIGQYITPITPINGIFNNSIHTSPSTSNSIWMQNRATNISQLWRMLNGVKIPAYPAYTGYAVSSLPTLPTAASISQTNPSSNDFHFYNGLLLLPTMTTMKPNYQKTAVRTDDYGSKQQQKDPRIHFEKKYPINTELRTSKTVDSMANRGSLIPASEFLILS